MPVQLDPYLSFGDRQGRDAIEFYNCVFGGLVDVFGEQPNMPDDDPSLADKIMHAQLTATTASI